MQHKKINDKIWTWHFIFFLWLAPRSSYILRVVHRELQTATQTLTSLKLWNDAMIGLNWTFHNSELTIVEQWSNTAANGLSFAQTPPSDVCRVDGVYSFVSLRDRPPSYSYTIIHAIQKTLYCSQLNFFSFASRISFNHASFTLLGPN